MDANTVVIELLHRGIVDEGDQKEMSGVHNPKMQNEILHERLKKKCTNDALRTVCDVMIGVAGNPRMAALGNDMKRRLETGNGMCMCVHFNESLRYRHMFVIPCTTTYQFPLANMQF